MAITKTAWREIGPHRRMRVVYGMRVQVGQEPYFSITGEQERQTSRGWEPDAFGQMRDEIREHFPELASLVMWHLVKEDSGPLFYLENGEDWRWQAVAGKPGALEHFKTTILYGADPSDEGEDHDLADAEEIRVWLVRRLPAVMERFRAAMRKHGIT